MNQEIAQLIAQIEVTPKNEALVDRLKECRYADLWDHHTVNSVISYAIHATDCPMHWNIVKSILRTVLWGMEPAELHQAAELSRDAMKWIDPTDQRGELHRMVLDVAEVAVAIENETE